MIQKIVMIAALTAQNATAECELSNQIMTIQRPFFPDQAMSFDSFKYSFKWIQRNPSPDAITVIRIPGGPSELSMGGDGTEYPPEFNVVYTDPRGAGCNTIGDPFPPDEFYGSKYVAADILEIVRTIGAKKYILHGISYGTVVATIAAYAAQSKSDIEQPKAVILEGTIGHADSAADQISGFQTQWQRVLSSLPESVQQQFRNLKSDSTLFGYSSQDWGDLITFVLYAGSNDIGESPLHTLLLPLSVDASPEQRDNLRKQIAYMLKIARKMNSSEDQIHLYNVVECSEIQKEATKDAVAVHDGTLVYTGNEICKSSGKSKILFDSANFQLQVPIFYLEGEYDPATPYFQAEYHFLHQTKAKRHLVLTKFAGHAAFNISLNDCKMSIWNEISTGGSMLQNTLRQCQRQSSLKIGQPTNTTFRERGQ